MKRLPLLVLLCACWMTTLPAQSMTGLLKGPNESASPVTSASDPLGRDTPSGAFFGFLQVAQSGNYKSAADYLQLSTVRRQSQGPDLAAKLKVLMDRAFVGNMRRISQSADGSPESGDQGTQNIGAFVSGGEADVPVVLVRVAEPGSGKVWLFSYETLSRVPELYDNLQAHRIESKLSPFLTSKLFLGMPLWQWLALLLAIPVAAAIGWVIVLALAVPRRLWLKYRNRPNLHSYIHLSGPLLLFFGAIAHRVLTSYLGLPLLPRVYYYRAIGAAMGVGFFWFLFRANEIAMQRIRGRAIGAGRAGTGTLLVLGERLLKAILFGIAVLVILAILGFNLTTVLAGVGIGGIAIAFAAQKTLENLFGGVSLLADEVIRVGDTCRFVDRIGTIEDISLRSTRIRTPERTELSIPNGALAAMNVENLTRRDKMLFNPIVSMRYETTPDQLRFLLAEVRRMLYEHPKIETTNANIRLANFDASALRLEIVAYVLTNDANEFNAIREDLLLRIMDIVKRSGTDFALPAQTLYVNRGVSPDREKVAAAEQQVQRWREDRQLPFPDFAPTDKAGFRGGIAYPDPDSPWGTRRD
jgi:MscS family membrane protein